jgi:hypothetical protein
VCGSGRSGRFAILSMCNSSGDSPCRVAVLAKRPSGLRVSHIILGGIGLMLANLITVGIVTTAASTLPGNSQPLPAQP